MRIRDLKWRTVPIWPPEWWISDQGLGEEGVLEEVQLRNDLTPRLITAVANHLGESRKGIVVLEDPAHLKVLYHKLKENIGRPLTEIGYLEIDFFLSLPKKGLKQVRPQTMPSSRSTLLSSRADRNSSR